MTIRQATSWLSQPGIVTMIHDPTTRQALRVAVKALERLMFTQPISDARDTQYNLPIGTDCISRQQAIDAVDVYMKRLCRYIGTSDDTRAYAFARGLIVGIKMDIGELPSAQPEPSQVARDIARIVENEKDMRILPKMGKWICTGEPDESWGMMYKCSICGYHDYGGNYCSYCGAKMEDEDE